MPSLVGTPFTMTGTNASNAASTTASFTPTVGEVVVVTTVLEDSSHTATAPTSAALTFTQQINYAPGSSTRIYIWTAVAASATSTTITANGSAIGAYRSTVISRWSSAQLAATPATLGTGTAPSRGATGSGTPNGTITTAAASSVVVWAHGDWNAVGGARTYRTTSGTPVEMLSDQAGAGSHYIANHAYQPAAAAGSQTVGTTAPTGQDWDLVGIEIQHAGGGGGSSLTATPADNLGITDSVSVSVTYSRAITDTVGIADTGSEQTLDLAQVVADQVGISDNLAVVRSLARTITDTVGVVDTVGSSASTDASATPADVVGVTDTLAVIQAFARNIADAVGLADNATASVTTAGATTQPDHVAVTDQISTAVQAHRTHADPIGLTDALVLLVDRVISDAVGVTDSVTVSLTNASGSSTSDGVGIGDQAGVVLQVTRTATDAIGVADAVAAVLIADPSGYENVTVRISLAPRRTQASLANRTAAAELGARRTTATLEDR